MFSKQIFVVFLLFVGFDLELSAQGGTFFESEVTIAPGNCKYKVKALTKVDSGGTQITVYALIDWSLMGRNSFHSESHFGQDIAMGTGTVQASFERVLSIPTFDDWDATWFSTHFHSASSNTWTDPGSTTLTHCNHVAGGGDGQPDCTGEGTVTEDGIWIAEGTVNTCTPVIIDLGGDGIVCGGADSAVYFDMLASGAPLLLQWVEAGGNDAFLVHDLNGNGRADDGGELFGSGTRLLLEDGRLADNGFTALAQFDDPRLGGDGDGFISAADAVWPELWLWLDDNADGISQEGETNPLAACGLTHLETIPKEAGYRDEHGNWYRYWALATGGEAHAPTSREMVDVYLVRLAGATARR